MFAKVGFFTQRNLLWQSTLYSEVIGRERVLVNWKSAFKKEKMFVWLMWHGYDSTVVCERGSFIKDLFYITDLYYRLPHEQMLECVQESIVRFGIAKFQNSGGVTVKGFMQLLSLYLISTFVHWRDHTYFQNRGG